MAGAEASARQGDPILIHASAVALDGRALLILGPSGSGKSALALVLMSLGAALVADDRTLVTSRPDGPPLASSPDTTRGLIEARGFGLLAADPAPPTPIAAAIDLAQVETERLPPERHISLAGAEIRLFHRVDSPYLPSVLIQFLKGGEALR